MKTLNDPHLKFIYIICNKIVYFQQTLNYVEVFYKLYVKTIESSLY